jgi:hypothetical protein
MCFAGICQCCECQGIHCLIDHPGHSCGPDSKRNQEISEQLDQMLEDLMQSRNDEEDFAPELTPTRPRLRYRRPQKGFVNKNLT